MKQGFYAIQFTNGDVKIDTISYGSFDPSMFNNAMKVVFLTDSIAGFLLNNPETKDPEQLAIRLVSNMVDTDGLNMFSKKHYAIIMKILTELIRDYLK